MLDVLIAGAGPAGSIAGLVLARAGARVVIVDRDTFPRDKLCGDTLNPGAVRALIALGLGRDVLAGARPLAGMLVSGPRAQVVARYGGDCVGLAIARRDLDSRLLDAAVVAGARVETGLTVRGPLVHETSGTPLVRGLVVTSRGSGADLRLPATLTIAADGRRSAVARALGLLWHPRRPRRWAFGVYATGVTGLDSLGEMHIRSGWYVGLAPLTDSLANICVVTGARPDGRTPQDVIRRAIARLPDVHARCRKVEFVSKPQVLGPLAAEARAAGVPGVLLAGDAAGFIDPMTGDGMSLAIRGAELAAGEALRALESGNLLNAAPSLAAARADQLGAKLRFNRGLRRLVDAPMALDMAAWSATVAPAFVRRAIRYAGDTP